MKKPKRPPRQVWLLMRDGVTVEFFRTRREAKECCFYTQDRVVGPYVLAERVREK